ncbi:hypothetical protein ACTXT7_006098 [Hymenolepis weldensis]
MDMSTVRHGAFQPPLPFINLKVTENWEMEVLIDRCACETTSVVSIEYLSPSASVNCTPYIPQWTPSNIQKEIKPLQGQKALQLPDNTSHGRASSITSDVASNATGHSFHHLPVSDHPSPQLLPSDTFALGSCANSPQPHRMDAINQFSQVEVLPIISVWLGLGAARGRIYSKHPWIFRYACDREDKGWLSRAGHLPNSGAKAFLVLAKQIQEVAALEEREEGMVIPTTRQPLSQFVLPSWLFQKPGLISEAGHPPTEYALMDIEPATSDFADEHVDHYSTIANPYCDPIGGLAKSHWQHPSLYCRLRVIISFPFLKLNATGQVFDSTLNRQNTAGSRLPGSISGGGQHGASSTSSISTNRHFNSETSTSSARRPPSLQRSTPFVDQFAFTEEEMGLEDDLFSTEQSTHSGTWPNRDRSPPLIRNGRNHNTQSDTVYKSGRQGETGLKIGQI